MSLRRSIIFLTVGVASLVLLIFAVPLVLLLQQAARASAVERATDTAQGVADYMSAGSDTATLRAYVERINRREDDVQVAVHLPDGSRVGAVDIAPEPQMQPHPPGDFDRDRDDGRFASTSTPEVRTVAGGRLVTVAVADGSGAALVSALVTASSIRHTVESRLLVAGIAAVGAMALAAIAAELVARRLVSTLTQAATTADSLGDGDLTARAPEDGPTEVRRVSAALNRLAGRIDELIVTERETVADLSHRLRTPLTAVRLDVEALPDSAERGVLADHLDLLERTLTAVIRAARRPEREGAAPSCQPSLVVSNRVSFWTPLLEDQGREITVLVPDDLRTVRCAAEDLGNALDALLENVVAHTRDGVPVQISAHTAGEQVVVEIRDQGGGIPSNAVHRGRSDRGSSGLGLDIARSCAEASGGSIEIDRDGSWTVVRLRLGPAQAKHTPS